MKIHTKKVTKEFVTGVTYTAAEFAAIVKTMLGDWNCELNIPDTDGWIFDYDTSVKIGGEVTLLIDEGGEYGLPERVVVERPATKKKATKK